MKSGANSLTHFSISNMITNIPLMIGYSLYGLSTVLLVLALRDGELSLLYPVIALTYVWVTMLSLFFFQERMNVPKALGVTINEFYGQTECNLVLASCAAIGVSPSPNGMSGPPFLLRSLICKAIMLSWRRRRSWIKVLYAVAQLR